MNQELCYQKVVLVAKGENFFSQQFHEREVPFTLADENGLESLDFEPDLILAVNQGLRRAEAFKAKFASATVVVCQGGAKHFSPLLTVVWGQGVNEHDYHHFASWDAFFSLLSTPFLKQEKILQQVDDGVFNIDSDLAKKTVPLMDGDETMSKRTHGFNSMYYTGERYLGWYLDWLAEVERKRFPCHFTMRTDGSAGKKKVSIVSVRYFPEVHVHKGVEVFNLEDWAMFRDSDGRKYPASVVGVDTGDRQIITFKFGGPLTRKKVSRLTCFQKIVNKTMHNRYLEMVHNLEVNEGTLPLRVLAGSANNSATKFPDEVKIDPRGRKILCDQWQCEALAATMSNQPVTCIEGIGGSGKTTLQAMAAKNFYQQGKIIFLVSHSNKGLDVLLNEAVLNLGKEQYPFIFRLGNGRQMIEKVNLPFHRLNRFEAGKASELELAEIQQAVDNGKGVIIACTLNGLVVDETIKKMLEVGLCPDVSFLDEASRGRIYEVVFLYSITREKVINTLDRRQLSDIPLSVEARWGLKTEWGLRDEEIDDFDAGVFKSFLRKGFLASIFLRICRRSLPKIIEVFNAFYDGQVIPGRFEDGYQGQVIVYDFCQAQDRWDEPSGNSRINRREANFLAQVFKRYWKKSPDSDLVGIITFYQGQVREIQNKLRAPLIFALGFDQEEFDASVPRIVNTVDAFQGSQRRIIFLSMVNSNMLFNIGFNYYEERVVVSLTRPEDCLVIFINSETFLQSDQASPNTKAAIQKAIEIARGDSVYFLVK